jgi:hypothetical protein
MDALPSVMARKPVPKKRTKRFPTRPRMVTSSLAQAASVKEDARIEPSLVDEESDSGSLQQFVTGCVIGAERAQSSSTVGRTGSVGVHLQDIIKRRF